MTGVICHPRDGKEKHMAIVRVPKVNNYTIMSNHHLIDPELSFKAKGLMSYMLSRPDNWDFSIEGLAHQNKEGTDAIARIIRELEEQGYYKIFVLYYIWKILFCHME